MMGNMTDYLGDAAPSEREPGSLGAPGIDLRQKCENCGRPVGPSGGYPPPGYTTETADRADAWCEDCALGQESWSDS